ncbi:unnamed protein product [Eruca vesicaria subsp. sativa]|uniref:Uncharacterized protein n=1 Tax=Eruca vesicaria subsp. sativa TaxID=29727 RepID=A0ABC8K7I7_ERUVS|nr:unnamed protein product [Eruca vesicaria subsp. sativa]
MLRAEGMTNNGFQIPSSDYFYSWIVFNINQLKNILLSWFKPYGPDNIAREELSKAEATTASNAQPQHRGSDLYETWPSHVYQSIPCGEQIHQSPTASASQLVLGPQSVSSTSPAIPTDRRFEALTTNFKQCEIWNGSAYMISRKPFDPNGRPFNPFGPIERPFPRLPSSDELADLGFA